MLNKIRPIDAVSRELIQARDEQDITWEKLPAKARAKAQRKQELVHYVIEQAGQADIHVSTFVGYLLRKATAGELTPPVIKLLSQGIRGALVSKATVLRWIKAYRVGGQAQLAPGHQGSKPKAYGWESRALYWLKQASNPNPGNIAKILQQEGDETATYTRVRAWYRRLPANIQYNRGRLGDLAYSNTRRFNRRHTNTITVGECYQSDGNKMPIYLRHPTGARPARYEMTPCIDVKSRYLAGYWIGDEESADGTVRALTDSVIKEGHVPLDVQADNGPGFSNERLNRVYAALGITPYHGRAYNPKDNGYIERWHQTLKNEFLKRLPGYCGKDAAPEPTKDYLKKARNGEAVMLTLEQFREHLDNFIHWYNHERVHEALDGHTPAELWQQIEKNSPPEDLHDIVLWDQVERTVSRQNIRLFRREYEASELTAYHNKKVIVEYNIYDDTYVKIRDLKGRWICDATIIKAAPYRSNSVMDDRRRYSKQQKLKRVESQADEIRLRDAASHDHTADLVTNLEAAEPVQIIEHEPAPITNDASVQDDIDDLDIDLTTTDY